jgi:hypothetical protein
MTFADIMVLLLVLHISERKNAKFLQINFGTFTTQLLSQTPPLLTRADFSLFQSTLLILTCMSSCGKAGEQVEEEQDREGGHVSPHSSYSHLIVDCLYS